MTQQTLYKPRSNTLTSMSIKSRYQPDYNQMREDAAEHDFSQCDVMILGYRECLQGQPKEVWNQWKKLLEQ